jgi:hypothetical protein
LLAAHRLQRTDPRSPAPDKSRQRYPLYNTVVLNLCPNLRNRLSATAVQCILEPEVEVCRDPAPVGNKQSDRASLAECVRSYERSGTLL